MYLAVTRECLGDIFGYHSHLFVRVGHVDDGDVLVRSHGFSDEVLVRQWRGVDNGVSITLARIDYSAKFELHADFGYQQERYGISTVRRFPPACVDITLCLFAQLGK